MPTTPAIKPAPAAARPPAPAPTPATSAEPLFDARSLIRNSVTSLSTRASVGEVTNATLATLRSECPGWDYQVLHQEFRDWIGSDPTRTPVNYQNAFIGFVRRFDAKNRHTLR